MNYAIWVTAACNLQCKYCYEGSNKPHISLNRKKIDDILDYIRTDLKYNQDKELQIDFHGGEPFLEFGSIRYFVEKVMSEYAKEKNILFGTTTNATILNKDILDFIVQYIPELTVSLDGTREVHDYMRPFKNGEGSYDIALKNSLCILERLPNIRVRVTVTSKCVDSLAEGVKNLIGYGFKTIVPAIDLYDKGWNDERLEILACQICEIKQFLKTRSDVVISLCDPVYIRKRSICRGGRDNKNIYPDGSIYPCMMAGGQVEFNVGSIYEGINQRKLENILGYGEQIYTECIGCALKNACNGNRCKIINRMITGDYLMPSEVECEVNHILYKLNGAVR